MESDMHYEEKWIDGWLWCRRRLDEPWTRASDEQMIARLRTALALVIGATDIADERRTDLSWLRGALLAARSAALSALGGEAAAAAISTAGTKVGVAKSSATHTARHGPPAPGAGPTRSVDRSDGAISLTENADATHDGDGMTSVQN